jgi:hypothetical protein
MRRCGRTTCLVGAGLLVATLVAGGTLAAPGGNRKGRALAKGHAKYASGQGNGLALAKGHAKRVPRNAAAHLAAGGPGRPAPR